jgi:hypothetical protein
MLYSCYDVNGMPGRDLQSSAVLPSFKYDRAIDPSTFAIKLDLDA